MDCKAESTSSRRVNFLIGITNPDGIVARYCLVNREGFFEQYVYGQDIYALADNCRKEAVPFQRGDVVTTIKNGTPVMVIGQAYCDVPANADALRQFTREIERQFL